MTEQNTCNELPNLVFYVGDVQTVAQILVEMWINVCQPGVSGCHPAAPHSPPSSPLAPRYTAPAPVQTVSVEYTLLLAVAQAVGQPEVVFPSDGFGVYLMRNKLVSGRATGEIYLKTVP